MGDLSSQIKIGTERRSRGKDVAIIVLSVLCAGFLAALLMSLYALQHVAAQPAPVVYTWQQVAQREYVIEPGAGMTFGPVLAFGPVMPGGPAARAIRFDVAAGQAINVAVVDDVGTDSARCQESNVIHSTVTCAVPDNYTGYITLRDIRDPNAQLGAVAGAVLGLKEPLQRATAENRVTLTIYDWLPQIPPK